MRSRNWNLGLVGAGLLGLLPAGATATGEELPSAPVRIVIGIPVGASPDVATRALAGEMQAALGQSLVVENRPGAGGTLATALVAAAPPDGHTLNVSGCSADAIVYSYLMSGRPAFDPFKDFTPVGQLMRDHWVVLVSPDLGVDSLERLVQLARERQAPLAFPSQGEGSSPHLQSERLARRLGFKALHVPYKDSPMSDLAAARLDFAVQPSAAATGLIKAGKLKALAVLSDERIQALPDVPTAREAGLADYTYNGGMCLWAPGQTPVAVVQRLSQALLRASTAPAVIARFAALGIDTVHTDPQETAQSVKALMSEVDSLRQAVFGKSR